MDAITVKDFVDSCHQAKRITELLPDLPSDVTSRSIHVVDAIHELSASGRVRVSDVSAYLDVTRPSITKAISDLASLGYIDKKPSETDGRTIYVELTPEGEGLWNKYIDEYYKHMATLLGDIPDQDVRNAIKTIEKVAGVFYEAAHKPIEHVL